MPRTCPSIRRRRLPSWSLVALYPRVGAVSMAMHLSVPGPGIQCPRIRCRSVRTNTDSVIRPGGMLFIGPDPERKPPMSQTLEQQSYTVLGMSCGHCRAAIISEIQKVDG